jgi:hypothetical protein
MSRLARSVFLTAVLTASAVVVATLPAGAQTREGLLLTGKASVSDTGNTTFSTGMVEQATPPPGGGGPRARVRVGAKSIRCLRPIAQLRATTASTRTRLGGVWFGGNRGGRVGVMGEVLCAKRNKRSGLTEARRFNLEIPIWCGEHRVGAVASASTDSSDRCDINLKASLNNLDVKSMRA